MPNVQSKAKAGKFLLIIAALTVLEGLLILAGILPPLSAYSAVQIIFILAQIATVAYMGFSLAKLGLKKIAVKGALAGLVMMAVVSVFSAIGYVRGIPVLGVPVQAAAYLPIVLLVIAVPNILLFAIFAIAGALLAPKKTMKKK